MKENSFLFRSEAYKRSVPQFQSEEALHLFYLEYSSRENEEIVFQFWRGQVLRVMENVFCSFVVTYGELQEFFLIHSRIPLALSKVLVEMKKEGLLDYFEKFQDWKQKKEEPPPESPGLIKRVFGYLSGWLSSTEKKEWPVLGAQTKVINLGLVEVMVNQSKKLAHKIKSKIELNERAEGLIRESELKRLALEVLERDYEPEESNLIIDHLVSSDMLSHGVVDVENEEIKVFKIQGNSGISELDKAHLMIDVNIQKLGQKIHGLEDKYAQMTDQAKNAVHQKRMDFARLILSSRKKMEKHQEHLQILVFELEKQRIALSASESNASLYSTLKQAEQAMTQTTVKAKQIEEVVLSLEEKKAEQDDLADIVKQQAESEYSDADILKELEAEFEKENQHPGINLPSAPSGTIKVKEVRKAEAVLMS